MARLRLPLVALVIAAGCAHTAARGSAPGFIDQSVTHDAPDETRDLARLARGDARARIVRLDRLLDLFDAARFGNSAAAREALWTALGGHSTGVGVDATRDALRLLLTEALAIEATVEDGAPELQYVDLLSDAIHLLSVDLEHPAAAEAMAIRATAYRSLAAQGHPRVADNARWRLYDHARGTLAAAVAAPAAARMTIAVQASYAELEPHRVAAFLADGSPHARPAWPAPDELWSMVERARDPLRDLSRWQAVLRERAESDEALRDTVRAVLPAQRDPRWRLPVLATGTARQDSLAPVVRLGGGAVVIDEGRPQARTVRSGDDVEALRRALQTTLSQDGRGTVLLLANPQLPAPELRHALRGLRRAQASRVELAALEARPDGAGNVVVALPLAVARSSDTGAGAAALRHARVHLHLRGRGLLAAIDGRWLTASPSSPSGLTALARELALAYPRERIVALTIGVGVAYPQLVGLLAAFEGGRDPAFGAVGWWAGGSPPPGEPSAQNDAALQRRVGLGKPVADLVWTQPFPLHAEDQVRLDPFGRALARCLPELEAGAGDVRVTLRFDKGRLVGVEAPTPLAECMTDEAYRFRLRQHRDALELGLTFAR